MTSESSPAPSSTSFALPDGEFDFDSFYKLPFSTRKSILLSYQGRAQIITEDERGEHVFYNPSPRQDSFHLAPEPNVLYGGAAGGGKSHAIRMDAYMRCMTVPRYRALLLRRSFPELEKTHIEKAILEDKLIGANYARASYQMRWPNGSILDFGHCEDDSTISKYLSTEYDAIYFDELVTFTEHQFKFISSRARSSQPGITPVVRAGTNPGGQGAAWVKALFIDKNPDREKAPFYDPAKYRYIPATLDDNPWIDETYEQRLMELPSEALRQAYRYGNWDTFEGQYFTEWRAKTDAGEPWHVIPELPLIDGVPITEVPWIEVFRALDWGYRQPGVCGWYAALPDGRLLKFKEYVFRSMTGEQVAKEIKRLSKGMRVRYTVADYSMWMSEGSYGESLQEIFSRCGVPLQKADKERINGWMRFHSWLTETTTTPSGRVVPLLQFYGPGCPYTIRTIPSMVVDKFRPEDLETKNTEDHAADETRYALMSRPSPSRRREQHDSRSEWLTKTYTRDQVGYHTQKALMDAQRKKRRRLGAESVRKR